jgi:hypothetical protein
MDRQVAQSVGARYEPAVSMLSDQERTVWMNRVLLSVNGHDS